VQCTRAGGASGRNTLATRGEILSAVISDSLPARIIPRQSAKAAIRIARLLLKQASNKKATAEAATSVKRSLKKVRPANRPGQKSPRQNKTGTRPVKVRVPVSNVNRRASGRQNLARSASYEPRIRLRELVNRELTNLLVQTSAGRSVARCRSDVELISN